LQPDLNFEAEPLNDLADAAVLELSRHEGRILVTHDIRTIPPLVDTLRRNATFPGVIVTPCCGF
jgi:hypothetical protein